MKLSPATIEILNNFSSINPKGVNFPVGNIISTVSEFGTIVVKATIEESFEEEFSIYNIAKFLRIYKLLNSEEIKFNSDHLLIGDLDSNIEYYFCDKDAIILPPINLKIPETNFSFELNNDKFDKLKEASDELGFKKVKFSVSDNIVKASLTNIKNEGERNIFSIFLGKCFVPTEDAEITFDITNFKMIDDEYIVKFAKKYGYFLRKETDTNKANKLEYWVSANIQD